MNWFRVVGWVGPFIPVHGWWQAVVEEVVEVESISSWIFKEFPCLEIDYLFAGDSFFGDQPTSTAKNR